MVMKIKYLSNKIGNEVPKPFYATSGAAGLDLAACIDEDICVNPQERLTIPTGLAVAIPEGFVCLIFPRSSLGLKFGITLPNSVGVIDSDYRGELLVAVTNISNEPFVIEVGSRIAQLVVVPVAQADLVVVDELEETVRGSGGFGSTGL